MSNRIPAAIYHITSRGDRHEAIFVDDADREALRAVVAQGIQRFDAQVLAYSLMGNHYHFMLHTRQANLSRLMQHINGVYTQVFNRRHGKVGHLFLGRFKTILVDHDAYLLEVPVSGDAVIWITDYFCGGVLSSVTSFVSNGFLSITKSWRVIRLLKQYLSWCATRYKRRFEHHIIMLAPSALITATYIQHHRRIPSPISILNPPPL